MILCAMLLCSIVHSIICTWLSHGKMHSYWFKEIEILQGRWQHGEKVGHSYPRGLEKTLFKWDMYVLLVTKGLISRTVSALVSVSGWLCSKVNSIAQSCVMLSTAHSLPVTFSPSLPVSVTSPAVVQLYEPKLVAARLIWYPKSAQVK
jgi:hypothetical protein